MEIWKKHIIRGNHHFDQNQDEEAIKYYQLAVSRICTLFDHWFTAEEAVSALLVSYHNLGDLYLRNGETEKGLDCYRKVHNKLESALKIEKDNDRRRALLKGHSCSYTQLMTLTKRLNVPDVNLSLQTVHKINLYRNPKYEIPVSNIRVGYFGFNEHQPYGSPWARPQQHLLCCDPCIDTTSWFFSIFLYRNLCSKDFFKSQ